MELLNHSFETARLTFRDVVKSEIDELGHVNNTVYVKWIQDAAIEHWYAVAGDNLQDAVIWFCSRHEIDYKQQLYEGQSVEIRTWLGEVYGARFDRFIEIRLKGSKRAAVQAKTTWALIDKNTQKPRRITPDILSAFT